MEQEITELMARNWTDEEKELIQKITDGVMYYKRLIPKGLKTDIIIAIQLCNSLKLQLEKCECNHKIDDETIQIIKDELKDELNDKINDELKDIET
jgi:hypothetical protein